MDTKQKIDINRQLQDGIGWNRSDVMEAIGPKNLNVCVDSKRFITLVKRFQKRNNLKVDGLIGSETWGTIVKQNMSPKDRAVKTIVEPTVKKESGKDLYWAMNKDGEFRGLFDDHRAEGKIHVGLSFGFIQFTQDSGSLGILLKRACDANETKFEKIFGATYKQLVYVTNRDGPSGMKMTRGNYDGEYPVRSRRVQPVPVIDRHNVKRQVDIWEKPWTPRFEKFGKDPEFQAIQRQVAVEQYLEPILSFLRDNNQVSERMVSAAFSASVHRGPSGAENFIEYCHFDLDIMAEKDERYVYFINSQDLSDQKWEGWGYFNV
jgi:hypothetical protein